jgi:predicted Zn-ribbon and HTH transcriptional regulator
MLSFSQGQYLSSPGRSILRRNGERKSMVWVGKCKKCGARFSKPAHLKKGIGGVLLVCPNCNSPEWTGEEWTDIGVEWKDK